MRRLVFSGGRRGKSLSRRGGALGRTEIERESRRGVVGSLGEARGAVEVCRGHFSYPSWDGRRDGSST